MKSLLCIIIITTGLVLYNFVATQKNIPSIEKYSKDLKVYEIRFSEVTVTLDSRYYEKVKI